MDAKAYVRMRSKGPKKVTDEEVCRHIQLLHGIVDRKRETRATWRGRDRIFGDEALAKLQIEAYILNCRATGVDVQLRDLARHLCYLWGIRPRNIQAVEHAVKRIGTSKRGGSRIPQKRHYLKPDHFRADAEPLIPTARNNKASLLEIVELLRQLYGRLSAVGASRADRAESWTLMGEFFERYVERAIQELGEPLARRGVVMYALWTYAASIRQEKLWVTDQGRKNIELLFGSQARLLADAYEHRSGMVQRLREQGLLLPGEKFTSSARYADLPTKKSRRWLVWARDGKK